MKIAKKILIGLMICSVATSFCFARKIKAETAVVNSDWKDKALGEEEKPAWVMQLLRGRDSVFRRDYGIRSDSVVRVGRGTGYTLNSAKTKSELSLASAIANELKMNIVTNLSETSDINKDELGIIDQVATNTQVQVAQLKNETDFWWKTLERDPVTRKPVTKYVYVTVYSMPEKAWESLVQGYMLSVMKGLEDQKLQKAVGGQFSSMCSIGTMPERDEEALASKYKNVSTLSEEKSDEQKELDATDQLLKNMLQ
ncbi:MAG: hypothetical protein K6G52_03160 [Treponemataceae bacterium]|nr:hypothetical protein [Treponemataceae bacterium]